MKLSCAAALLAIWPGLAFACGAGTDCVVETGSYRIDLPDPAKSPLGAVVFAHGYRGSAAGVMKNTSLRKMATDRGLALIALDSGSDDWNLPGSPGQSDAPRDEMAYLDAVMADTAARFGVDPAQSVITGFSAGGMFVWNVICNRGDAYGGYIPYAGTFWQGPPATCAAPAQNVVHVHGTADRTVPLAGRAIAGSRQGDVHEVLAMYMKDKGFGAQDGFALGDLSCSHATNVEGKRLDLCLFNGAHSFTAERLSRAYDLLMPGN